MRTDHGRPTYIYGAGRVGLEVLARCRSLGIEPKAFVDRRAGEIAAVDDLKVIAPDEFVEAGPGSRLILALHSPGVDVGHLATQFASRPSIEVRTLWAECRGNHWLPRSPFWLDPGFDWAAHEGRIARARALLGDEASRRVFDEQLALRRDGDYAGLSAPTPDDQYVPEGLQRWREPMRLLDCGAFDGDTIRLLQRHGYDVAGAIALEPDPFNFEQLRRGLQADPSFRLLMAGAASFDGRLSFDAGAGTSARIDANGDTTIAVTRLDSVCEDFHPTLIKMDIEGGEMDALDGAAATIERDRPDLAISVYHRVHDLWTLALAIDDRVPGYRYHLRSHAFNGFETVLYAYAPR